MNRTVEAPAQTPAAALKEPAASVYIGMSCAWLRVSRMRGTGPSYCRVGRSIRYMVKDLDAWLDEHRVQTSEAR